MDIRRIIKLLYIGYTIYVIIIMDSTSIKFFTIIPALLIMWINYLCFSSGYCLGVGNATSSYSVNYQSGWLNNRNKVSLLFIAGISVLFSILAVQYYTGQTPISTFRNLISGVSVYYEYQAHLIDKQIGEFSIAKLPFVFMLFYIKFITFYSYISFFISKREMKILDKYYIFIVTLSYLYVGIARGTNFEFFEMLILVVFIVLFKKKSTEVKIPIKRIVGLIVLMGAAVFIFYSVINARGVIRDVYISQDVIFNPSGILPTFLPVLSFVAMILYDYFGFGFFYMSMYVLEVWFSSLENFLASLIPFGHLILVESSPRETMRNVVDMGARWQPDSAAIIGIFGYVGLLLMCFLMGLFCRYLKKAKNNSPMNQLTAFIILLQMISLPVGNFLSTSSASKLTITSLMLYWIWKIFIVSAKR